MGRRKTSAKKFWEVLATIRGWKLTISGYIRRGERNTCPVCAVANKILGTRKHRMDAWRAAKEIGLSTRYANEIVGAADNYLETPKQNNIRNHLLKVSKLA